MRCNFKENVPYYQNLTAHCWDFLDASGCAVAHSFENYCSLNKKASSASKRKVPQIYIYDSYLTSSRLSLHSPGQLSASDCGHR